MLSTAVVASVAVLASVRITGSRRVVSDGGARRSRAADLFLNELLSMSDLLRVAADREVFPVGMVGGWILVDLNECAGLFFDAVNGLATFADDDSGSTGGNGVVDLLFSSSSVVAVHCILFHVSLAVEHKLESKLVELGVLEQYLWHWLLASLNLFHLLSHDFEDFFLRLKTSLFGSYNVAPSLENLWIIRDKLNTRLKGVKRRVREEVKLPVFALEFC